MPLPSRYKTLTVDRLFANEFQKYFIGRHYETISDFSYTFEFGKSYLLDAKLNRGAWAISWAIGGLLIPLLDNTFYLDDKPITSERLRELSWIVMKDGYEKWWHYPKIYKSIRRQIQNGLKKNNHTNQQDIIDKFLLENVDRNLTQTRSEKLRLSTAIGYAEAKSIYCFPHMDYFLMPYLKHFGQNWLKEIIDFLTSEGALVLVPALLDEESQGVCDEVVPKALIDIW